MFRFIIIGILFCNVLGNDNNSYDSCTTLEAVNLSAKDILSNNTFLSCSLSNIQLKNMDLRHKAFNSCIISNVTLDSCLIDSTAFIMSKIDSLYFKCRVNKSMTLFRCHISNSDFSNCHTGNILQLHTNAFNKCSFENANMTNSQLIYTVFSDCNFKRANLSNSILFGIDFQSSYFSDANFSNSFLQHCSITNSKGLNPIQLISLKSVYGTKLSKQLKKETKRINKEIFKKGTIIPLKLDTTVFIDVLVNSYYYNYKKGDKLDWAKVVNNGDERLADLFKSNEVVLSSFIDNYYLNVTRIDELIVRNINKYNVYKSDKYEILYWMFPYHANFLKYIKSSYSDF